MMGARYPSQEFCTVHAWSIDPFFHMHGMVLNKEFAVRLLSASATKRISSHW
jgi:hypothetical protein